MNLLILNGPNLNLLGTREPEIYGHATLADIEAACRAKAHELGMTLEFRQTNHEGELVEWIQTATHDALILNAAAYTHTSVAMHDALKAYIQGGATAPHPTANAASLCSDKSLTTLPVKRQLIEVHLSNPHKREPFRHVSYVSSLADAVICGLGAKGYVVAIESLHAADHG
jgi:3-dehydroquinate dehydratase-2